MPLARTSLALAIAAIASAIQAHDTSLVAPGDPVQVRAPAHGMRTWAGYFIGFRGDSIVVWNATRDSSLAVIPFSDVRFFSVNHGDRPPRTHVKMGLFVGAGIGFSISLANAILYPCEGDSNLCNETFMIAAFTVGGALTGALAGALYPTPTYEEVKLRPRPTVAPLPGGGFGVGLQFPLQP